MKIILFVPTREYKQSENNKKKSIKNKSICNPMKNILHSESKFEMHPTTFLIRNKIHTIFHIHPYDIAYPSQEDFRKSRALRIPYLIYSCIHDNFIYFNLKKCIPMKV